LYRVDFKMLMLYAIVLHPVIVGRFAMICYLLLYGGALLYLVINVGFPLTLFKRMNKGTNVALTFSVCMIAFAALYPIIRGTGDMSYIGVTLAVFRKLLLLFFLITYTRIHHGAEKCLPLFLYYYALSSCLYVSFTIILLVVPRLKSFWQDLIGRTEYLNQLYKTFGYSTRFGWSGFTGYRGTFDCSIALLFTLVLYADKNLKENIRPLRFLMMTGCCFLGNVFYGRTGIIVSFFCLIVGLLIYRKLSVNVFFTGVIVIVFIIAVFAVLKNYISIVNDMYVWAIKPVTALMTKGRTDNYSANHLFNDMIYMPEPKTLLFGDAMYTATDGLGAYYGHTDCGFMRQILFWGVGGCLFSYITTWISVRSLGNKFFKFEILSLFLFFVFEIKGEVFYEMIPLYILLGLLCAFNPCEEKISCESEIKEIEYA